MSKPMLPIGRSWKRRTELRIDRRVSTHWQELETHAGVQQWQEQEQQDHNFRHGAENSSHDYVMASTRPTVSRLAGV